MNKKLEICTDTLQSAINANNANADRIELCNDLQTGGITPSFGFVKKVIESIVIPINILIRPRAGNFYYSDDEFEIMCDDIKNLKSLPINGIVSGVLEKNGHIDYNRTKKLIDISKPLEFTFHRAIDNSVDIERGIKTIIDAGANKILTSGGYSNIDLGIDKLINVFSKYKNEIIIMPGGGLNFNNVEKLLDAGFCEFHFSASEFLQDNCYNNPNLSGMGHYEDKNDIGYMYSSKKKILEMKKIINK